MMLTNEQQEQVIHLLNSKNLGSKGCGMCGTRNSWQLEPVIYEVREFNGGPTSTEGALLPAIALSCNACGNTVFLSALRLGIRGPVQEEGGEAPPNEEPREV
jgi:hypothetical protein